jgi:uncharacterized protein YodC (DUF2158 family)
MKFSKIRVLQFILVIAAFLGSTEDATMFLKLFGWAVLFELAGVLFLARCKQKAIKAGDVVQLKSGGPKMVAEETDANLGWWCHWFDEEGKRQSMRFRVHMLHRA